jgi:EAL domain-containing protein (putative c-di-GMP-specific phosphodiesterase class I)
MKRRFIAELVTSPQSAAIVKAVIGLGHGLGLPVIAEGVETQQQVDLLRKMGCDQLQGFLMGRPQPISFYREQVAPVTGFAKAVSSAA